MNTIVIYDKKGRERTRGGTYINKDGVAHFSKRMEWADKSFVPRSVAVFCDDLLIGRVKLPQMARVFPDSILDITVTIDLHEGCCK